MSTTSQKIIYQTLNYICGQSKCASKLIIMRSHRPQYSLISYWWNSTHGGFNIIREVKHHVYVKWQNYANWYHMTKFPHYLSLTVQNYFYAHSLFFNFFSIRIFIVLSCFCLLIFYFEEFSTWIWCLPYAEYVKLKLSFIFS